MATTEVLLAMKAKIDNAKTKQAQLEGSLQAGMKRLKELGYADVASADAALTSLQAEIADLDDKVAKGIAELQTEYGL